MIRWRQTTRVLIAAAIVLLAVYDMFALMRGGGEATISVVVWRAARAQPIVAFAAGLLCGHLFWNRDPKLEEKT